MMFPEVVCTTRSACSEAKPLYAMAVRGAASAGVSLSNDCEMSDRVSGD